MKEFDKLITVDENLKEITEMITVYEECGIEKGMQKGILQNAKNAVLEALDSHWYFYNAGKAIGNFAVNSWSGAWSLFNWSPTGE